jgi:hypothetical protein
MLVMVKKNWFEIKNILLLLQPINESLKKLTFKLFILYICEKAAKPLIVGLTNLLKGVA